MMVKLLLYGYCTGVPSSRKIERATYRDVAFRVLAGDQHPDHDSIAEFRRRHLEALAGLFVQVLRLCQSAGLVKLGHVDRLRAGSSLAGQVLLAQRARSGAPAPPENRPACHAAASGAWPTGGTAPSPAPEGGPGQIGAGTVAVRPLRFSPFLRIDQQF